ncbi:MAG: bluetail domain-containing putative surface protein [Cyanobacteriota bacterium]|nr:bluetail domain-containing putative surface protein [Cyanobacteriota bacterium]
MSVAPSSTSYSAYLGNPMESATSDLDQVLGWIGADPGLAGANEASAIQGGILAAAALNALLVEGLRATGGLDKDVLDPEDILALNAWIRDPAHPKRLEIFLEQHGDDEGGSETGFHLIQNDGGNRTFDGRALVDTVLDGIYHIGFPISADGTRLTNEDGDDNALLKDVARWLTALKVDLATTGTGLDRIVETIIADPGLQAALPWADIRGGAQAANALNSLILEGIKALEEENPDDEDPTRLSELEVTAINDWIRRDPDRLALFIEQHGDDENNSETGYHLVQNDGANTPLFRQNAVDTIFDGIYHIGFEINPDGRFENEDGNANARVADVAEWLTYYYGDPSTTGSGLDRMLDWIKLDPGLSKWTPAKDINDGLAAADGLNRLFLEALRDTLCECDGWISRYDLRVINRWVREYRYEEFVLGHGDDEDGEETGFHLIQNDGASTNFFGRNLVDTVADGIYHYGFEIRGENFLNEDGNNNQSLSDVSGWLNYFLFDTRLTLGQWHDDVLLGNEEADQILGYGGNDVLDGQGGADLLDGGWGNDSLLGGAGADQLDGGFNDDWLDGGEDGDTYLVSGADPDWREGVPYTFNGFDIYADSGTTGIDVILAEGFEATDIGFLEFSPASGIEKIINATEWAAVVRLLGNWENNLLDFSRTRLVGGNFLVDGGWGCDTIVGTDGVDRIRGGGSDDLLNGGNGGDTYLVSGFDPTWREGVPYVFEGFDVFNDTGTVGIDSIVAEGDGPVDVGVRGFLATNGIEQIVNGTSNAQSEDGEPAEVRVLDTWESNRLDFSAIQFVGGSILVDASDGDDTVIGSSQADQIRGGRNDDWLDGGNGGDTYVVSGSNPEWIEGQPYVFEGFDTYRDSGANGVDEIVAVGSEPVDIGLRSFVPKSGIERIVNATYIPPTLIFEGGWPASSAAGTPSNEIERVDIIDSLADASTVKIIGNWESNLLDFSATELVGIFSIDGGGGDDTITGSAAADRLVGGHNNDLLDGGGGGDYYLVSGHDPHNPNWETYDFQGYDTYLDQGAPEDGADWIVAWGNGPVDVGFINFDVRSGIEYIYNGTQVFDGNGSIVNAALDLMGNWESNLLDFSNVQFIAGDLLPSLNTFRINGEAGNDTLIGTAAADRLLGGRDQDLLRGGAGDDRYEVSGFDPWNSNWQTYSFEGWDTYEDSSGYDTIVAVTETGVEAVDIGFQVFLPASGIELIDASGTSGKVRLLADWQSNVLDFSATELRGSNLLIDAGDGHDTVVGSAGADRILGGYGADRLLGQAGADTLTGGGSDDTLDGGAGADTYLVSGLLAEGWESFAGYDTILDTGTDGQDKILVVPASGTAAVDVGMVSFRPQSGIEVIDATATTGTVRLLADWQNNTLDFSLTTLLGANITIDSGGGDDTVVGSVNADTILAGDGNDSLRGGRGDDRLNGGGGSDTYGVAGTLASGFEGYDLWRDTGTGGGEVDRIVAGSGSAAVDIGMRFFSAATTGIEQILATGTTGQVRLLGDGTANTLDFTGVSLTGANISIDVGAGDDSVVGSTAADRILAGDGKDTLAGGVGDDSLYGGAGSDTYLVTGNIVNGFGGYDTWSDSSVAAADVDRIVAEGGTEAVDIGMKSFSRSATGIDQIEVGLTTGLVRLLGDGGANNLDFTGVTLLGANLRIDGGAGKDSIVGSAGADNLIGGLGDDSLNGAGGSDTYLVSGTFSSGFEGYDTRIDSGTNAADVDQIVSAPGSAAVDIGMTSFSLAATKIERIDASLTTGTVRLLGDAAANRLDFSGVLLLGSTLRIDGGAGNDTLVGSAASDTLIGGTGDDVINGAAGSDTYEVSGTITSGFAGYDTRADSGSNPADVDQIVAAAGTAPVDIGMKSFSRAATGIERIDATTTTGLVRLLGDATANSLNFTDVSLKGANLRIDGAAGNDTITGSSGQDVVIGGGGLDLLSGGDGVDTFVYTTLTDGITGGVAAAPTFERIVGFMVGQDQFDVTTPPAVGGVKHLGPISFLTSAAIGSLLNATNFVANGAATFTYGSGPSQRSFIAFNNSAAGYVATADAVLELVTVGYAPGFNALSQIAVV